MMKARVKQERSFIEDVRKANEDFLIDSNDAFFDMIDGIVENNNSFVSKSIKLAANMTKANIELASDLYEIMTNGK